MDPDDLLAECTGFDWDDGNLDKNWTTHRVAFWEAEEIFLNRPLVVQTDSEHSPSERRFRALGCTDTGRLLFTSFTLRGNLIRVISVREMNRRENRVYEQAKA